MMDFFIKWKAFLPLLFLYFFITILFSENTFQGDESRYVQFSENIINGYFANPDLKPGFLWNGPGYPIILAPFTYFKTPLILVKLLNSIFLFFGVIFLYKSLRFNLNHRLSTILSYFAGITHPFFLNSISLILTEAISFFLISVCLYYHLRFLKFKKLKHLLIFGFSSGFLILTKVFFSYVFLALGVISICSWIIYKQKNKIIPFLKLSFYPFIICIPYLIYTYSLTGKIFYWSDAGGSSLYSMSSPFETEYGDWFAPNENLGKESLSKTTTYKKSTLKENHLRFIKSLGELNGIEKDNKLKEQAIKNIKSNKIKYLKNIIYNFGRISIRYPFSNREIKPLYLLILVLHFSTIFVPLIISIILVIKQLNFRYLIPLLFFTVFLAGTLLLSAESRFIFPVYPIIIFIISILLDEKITINNNTRL